MDHRRKTARRDRHLESRGIFVISIDLELAWGACDRPLTPTRRRALTRERDIVARLADLFSRYDVRASWAVVGHLLLDECPRDAERVHPEIPRPVLADARRDWFFQHPRTADDALWYGRDIVARIRSARPRQEIASHSFCHIPYVEGQTNPEAVQADIEHARRCHETAGLPFRAFVFPRNVVGYRELLAGAGVRVYRGRRRTWYDRVRCRPLRIMLDFFTLLVRPVPPTVTPKVDATGMVNVPDSMLLYDRSGHKRLLSRRRLVAAATRGLNLAAARHEVFHLWFHPANFAHRTDEQFAILEEILRHAQRLRAADRLDILTLSGVAARSRARDANPIRSSGRRAADRDRARSRVVPAVTAVPPEAFRVSP